MDEDDDDGADGGGGGGGEKHALDQSTGILQPTTTSREEEEENFKDKLFRCVYPFAPTFLPCWEEFMQELEHDRELQQRCDDLQGQLGGLPNRWHFYHLVCLWFTLQTIVNVVGALS